MKARDKAADAVSSTWACDLVVEVLGGVPVLPRKGDGKVRTAAAVALSRWKGRE